MFHLTVPLVRWEEQEHKFEDIFMCEVCVCVCTLARQLGYITAGFAVCVWLCPRAPVCLTATSQLLSRVWVSHTFHFLQSASIQTLRGIYSIYLLVGFFCRCRRTSLEHTLSPHTPLHSRTHFSLKVFSLLSQSAGEIRLHTGEKRSHSDEWCAQLQHNALLLMCYWLMSVTGPPLYENTHTDTHTLAQHHIFMLSLATDTNLPLMVDVSTVLKIVPPSMEAVVSIFKLKLLMQTKILLIFLSFSHCLV